MCQFLYITPAHLKKTPFGRKPQHGGDAVAECFHFLAKFKEFLVYTYIMVVAYDLSTIFIAFSVRTEDREMNKFFLQLFIIHCQ